MEILRVVNRLSDLDTQETITQRELQVLRAAQAELEALEAAGVNNWEGYSYAMEILNGN